MARGMVKGWLTGALLALGLGASGCLAAHPHAYDGGYGYGFSPYGPYRSQAYYGFGPEVAYVPYRIASVWFIENRVDSWERAR